MKRKKKRKRIWREWDVKKGKERYKRKRENELLKVQER